MTTLYNSSEKRLARTLPLLPVMACRKYAIGWPPKVSQVTLAEMVGTARSSVILLMNEFEKMGFIKYKSKLQINTSLLSVVLLDPEKMKVVQDR